MAISPPPPATAPAAAAEVAADLPAKAPAVAAFAFQQACLVRLNVAQTPAAYVEGSDAVGRGLALDTPALAGELALDGDGGHGCRVRYTGARRDEAWGFMTRLFAGLTTGGPCTASAGTGDRLIAACVSVGEAGPESATRRATLRVERAPDGLVAALEDVRP